MSSFQVVFEAPSLVILALVALGSLKSAEILDESDARIKHHMEWAAAARFAAIKIQRFFWRHIKFKRLERFCGSIESLVLCCTCNIRRTYDRCELEDPLNTYYIV